MRGRCRATCDLLDRAPYGEDTPGVQVPEQPQPFLTVQLGPAPVPQLRVVVDDGLDHGVDVVAEGGRRRFGRAADETGERAEQAVRLAHGGDVDVDAQGAEHPPVESRSSIVDDFTRVPVPVRVR